MTTTSDPAPATETALHEPVLAWYAEHARDLPWRAPDATPWGVMVSEFMLQQTPVARVLPMWERWLDAWPTPAALAAEEPGEAVRAWGRLGYPRRALRLHAAARTIAERHDGEVPSDRDELAALPGVGEYTAAAIATFAHGRRHAVLDTNVRRVLCRVEGGVASPGASLTVAERQRAGRLLPDEPAVAAGWSVAVMELGALVCRAVSPQCERCPVAERCRWRAAGYPAYDGPARRVQQYAGTDRQCRGRLLEVLRSNDGPVHRSSLDRVWDPAAQRERCLASLVADGLAVQVGPSSYRLP
jgi:A/G-specific adenine glycosylase